MKTLKINSKQNLFILSFLILLFANACTHTGNKSKSAASTHTETTVATPKTDIYTAVLSDLIDVVKQHIAAQTDINEKEAMSGSTPLITAATFGKKEIAKVLIDAGADLSIQNNDGATALHTAAFFCHVEIVQMLIDAKADKTIKNNFGATPRESVMGPFAEIKPVYVMLQQQLAPMGLQIDLNEIEKTRPVIAMMLQ
ncbi:Ankyrin repeat-containing protein [Saccharicrinis carchari]|uniref:Ankyrin repeat-containing protein n=1 Tax=Saccharicrinis carchari TaxID=1168039 RepID=A0A521EC42_SACCC|nr:ankyrin repeat domain-containing protein [Saccharicrinis carchari]SMO81508.1 Ankyrin repeat-containing protein [Saccharicrinis carchari]